MQSSPNDRRETTAAPTRGPSSLRAAARFGGAWIPLVGLALLLGGAGPAAAKGGKVLEVGQKAPAKAMLRDLGGKVVDLGLLCGPDSKWNPRRPAALLLDFYMTTCGPCNAALPTLGEVARAWAPQKLRTLLLSLDGSARTPGGASNDALRAKLAPVGFADSDIVRDPGRVLGEDFGLVSVVPGKGRQVNVPRTFVLDGDCVVRGVYTDFVGQRAEIEALLQQILGSAPAPAPAPQP